MMDNYASMDDPSTCSDGQKAKLQEAINFDNIVAFINSQTYSDNQLPEQCGLFSNPSNQEGFEQGQESYQSSSSIQQAQSNKSLANNLNGLTQSQKQVNSQGHDLSVQTSNNGAIPTQPNVSSDMDVEDLKYCRFMEKCDRFPSDPGACSSLGAGVKFQPIQDGKEKFKMDKDLITLDLDTPLPFRLSGATPSQQVYISLRHMDDKRKLEPVHLCKKHRREDEDDGCKNKFLFQMNHPVCDHKIVDSHPTVAFPVKDLGPDKTMDFALTMLCLSSCHSKGKAKDKKGMELVLCLRETFPENKLVKEERFILHVYANWIRDHPKAVKRSQDNAASGAATTKLPRRAKEVETTKLVPATLSQASRVQDQWCFTEHQELRSEITAPLAVKHDCLQDNKTATLDGRWARTG